MTKPEDQMVAIILNAILACVFCIPIGFFFYGFWWACGMAEVVGDLPFGAAVFVAFFVTYRIAAPIYPASYVWIHRNKEHINEVIDKLAVKDKPDISKLN